MAVTLSIRLAFRSVLKSACAAPQMLGRAHSYQRPSRHKAGTQRPPTRWDREIRGKDSPRSPSAIAQGSSKRSAGLGTALNPRQSTLAVVVSVWEDAAAKSCGGKALRLPSASSQRNALPGLRNLPPSCLLSHAWPQTCLNRQ